MPGFLRPFALLTIALTSVACQAIDNPDAPHYLEDFRSEVSSHEQAVYEDAQTTSDSMEAYRDYIAFLEEELSAATSALEGEFSGSEGEAFAESQRAWEAYQEAEKAFVSSVWTPRNFGSSSAFSRLAFYADVLRSRIELLLKYRKQF
ncbi:lysozyme inhibitor LprI family protein [Marinobacter sp. M1N3S26]|uniref:lysozyme inhibitor LprI family protein n=1 Tax=Marinobacter sp. M1N3S26 TaxID=3382299 RepID=UPI00387AEDB6